jgi:hypothetical protein
MAPSAWSINSPTNSPINSPMIHMAVFLKGGCERVSGIASAMNDRFA